MYMSRRNFIFSSIILGLTLIVLTTPKAGACAAVDKQVFTGTVIGTGGDLGGVSRSFTLTIDRFASPAQARKDRVILREQGQEGLLKALQHEKLGTFALEGQLGRDLNFVYEQDLGGGRRRIVAVFERWLNTFEVRYGTRSQDYPFTYLELFIDSNGKGQGTLIPAARIHFDSKNSNQIDIENFGIYPARLVGVELRNP